MTRPECSPRGPCCAIRHPSPRAGGRCTHRTQFACLPFYLTADVAATRRSLDLRKVEQLPDGRLSLVYGFGSD